MNDAYATGPVAIPRARRIAALRLIAVLAAAAGFAAGCAEPYHAPPLIEAARHGSLDTVKELVATGADVNVVEGQAYTPLCAASVRGSCEIAEFLIAHGAAVNGVGTNRQTTPLHWAVMADQPAMVKLLLDRGAAAGAESYEGRPLSNARSVPVARLLLEHGAPVNTPGEQRAPLHAAAYDGRFEVLKELLARGANVNATNSWGATSLHEAARSEAARAELALALINAGANVNARDPGGSTPLHVAVGGFTGCMDGMIPFWVKHSIARSRIQVAEALVAHGADLDAADSAGRTPLGRAVEEGNRGGRAFLLKHGAHATTNRPYAGRH